MYISDSQLKEYRDKAESTQEVTILGEGTPLEFIQLLDYIDYLKRELSKAKPDIRNRHFATAAPYDPGQNWFHVPALNPAPNQVTEEDIIKRQGAFLDGVNYERNERVIRYKLLYGDWKPEINEDNQPDPNANE